MEKKYRNKYSGNETLKLKVITNHGTWYETTKGASLPQWYVEDSSDWEMVAEPSIEERVKALEEKSKTK